MLLSPGDLQGLRNYPAHTCTSCCQTVTRNYCRQHDEFFEDGHTEECQDVSTHRDHKSYANFSATTETPLAELQAQYRQEGSL